MKQGEYPDMEKALMTWLLQQRNQHIPVSTEMIQFKAKFFYKQLTGKDDFMASLGWIEKFKARHAVRSLKVCGEKVSSDVSAVEPFRQKLKNIIEEMDLDRDQIYNADESAAFWKVIPSRTFALQHEQSAPGRKISKDRVTFMPCCNASGTHKLPLLVIGKSVKPRSFKNFTLPLIYKASKKGWMSSYLFTEWYKTNFIPNVKKFLQENNRPLKAILIIDNAPCHPSAEDLGMDPNFRVIFLPPNCTAIIQPLDQNLIQNVKVSYRKMLLHHLLNENTELETALKTFNLRNAVTILNNAWMGISECNIISSWKPLFGNEEEWEDEDLIPLAQYSSVNTDLAEIENMLALFNPNEQIDSEMVRDWAVGVNEHDFDFSDQEIVQSVLQENTVESNDSDSDCIIEDQKITAGEAKVIFSKAIQFAEQINASMMDILVLRRFKETADKMHLENIKQTKINSYF